MPDRIGNRGLLIIMVLMTVVSANLNWGKDHWKSIVTADGKGYYAHLPAALIYHDLNYGFFDEIEKEKYYNRNLYCDYRAEINGRLISKYYCGTAVAELPFFLLAHLYCLISDDPADGYSEPYMLMISVAALFYLFIGLLFTAKLLTSYSVKGFRVVITLAAMVFGTNLFYYSVGEPGMSHVFSFAFVAGFVHMGRKFFAERQSVLLLPMALLLGMVVLIRPINGMVIFILPLLAGTWNTFLQGLKEAGSNLLHSGVGMVLFLAVISIQLVIYKLSTGQFLVDPYAQEGFHFLSPQIGNILFSYKKGLFLYTPVYLLAVCTCFLVWRRNRFMLFSYLMFFLLITYLLSSWWSWWYGGSFSSRVYVEFLPILIMPIGILLENIRQRLLRTGVISLLICLTVLCQIQTYQYRYYIIHWEDMTREAYWDDFLKLP